MTRVGRPPPPRSPGDRNAAIADRALIAPPSEDRRVVARGIGGVRRFALSIHSPVKKAGGSMRTHAAHPIPLRAVKLGPVIPPFGGSRRIARRYGPAAVGFGLRIMPGVRLSASPRGLRMGLGPRAARIHVGSGRPTISTRCRAGHGVDGRRAETPSYEWRWASEGFGSWGANCRGAGAGRGAGAAAGGARDRAGRGAPHGISQRRARRR